MRTAGKSRRREKRYRLRNPVAIFFERRRHRMRPSSTHRRANDVIFAILSRGEDSICGAFRSHLKRSHNVGKRLQTRCARIEVNRVRHTDRVRKTLFVLFFSPISRFTTIKRDAHQRGVYNGIRNALLRQRLPTFFIYSFLLSFFL